MSLVDALVTLLWWRPPTSDDPNGGAWPQWGLADLYSGVRSQLGYNVPESSVRSALYSHTNLFKRVPSSSPTTYELTQYVREFQS